MDLLFLQLYSVATREQQQMGRFFELMVQHSPVLLFIPAWKAISFRDPLFDSARPTEHGLEVCPTAQVNFFLILHSGENV